MVSIIIINGYPESGKDTFVEMCEKHGAIFNYHTSDPVKEALEVLGWKGDKTPEVRKLLSDLKMSSNKLFDTTVNYLMKKVQTVRNLYGDGIVFIHSREPEEIQLLRDIFEAETLFIKRDNPNRVVSNESDANVENYVYDMTIDNNGTLEELEEKAKNFVLLGDV